jgi:hypothetical protein
MRVSPAIVVALAGFLVAPAGAADVMPLDEVRPGMEGTGRTVFEGAHVEEFGVRILGVMENAVGPKQSLILARLHGGPLAETGVIQGMSGSPVFVDGRLVGAVAYSFPFGKEPIAGITPITEMIEATRTEAPRAASARFHPSLGPEGLPAPLDREAVAAAFMRPLQRIVPGLSAFRGEPLPPGVAGSALTPLALPLVFSGFDPATFEWARGLFSSLGFAPVLGSASSSAPVSGSLPPLEPGAAVGVSLIEGDLDMSVTGTITHIDHGRVYAFGHPFYNLGPTRFPMKKAWVYSIFPSLQVSWKIATTLEAVGTVDQDRATAVAGLIGETPRMISTRVELNSGERGEHAFRFRIVDDELFTPVLAYVSLLSVLQGHERAFGTTTMGIDARIVLDGGREVRVKDVLTGQPAPRAAALIAGPLGLLVTNRFERITVQSLEISVAAEEEERSATIERAWIDESRPLHPGDSASVQVLLRTRRGGATTLTLPLDLPPSTPPGTHDLLVADAATFDAVERQERRQAFVARDLPQLLEALNKQRAGNRVYARLTRSASGAIVGGEYLPALPQSVLSVLQSPDQGASVVPLQTSTVWSGEGETDYAVSGARRLTITVER